MAQVQCSNCGMQQTEWLGSSGFGYRRGESLYCCEGCAINGAGGCTCRVANPGVEGTGAGQVGAETLLTPRDRNGAPLAPAAMETAAARGEHVQLPNAVTDRPTTPAENPRTSTTN